MTHRVRRTCTEVGADDRRDLPASSSRPIEEFRETAAYVLLGAPGAGKTEAFTREAASCPHGYCVTARDFVTFDDRPEWHGATLFIDGLDEMRAGAADGRTPFDEIRRKLDALGQPEFRLSCREVHWFGADDRSHLESVSRNAEIKVLRLDPLSEDDVREILRRSLGIEDADAFMTAARERGIDGLLTNPLSLRMLAHAVTDDAWPETRMQTFEQAYRNLLREHNVQHRLATPQYEDVSRLLDVAGLLCAVQLLTGSAGYTVGPATPEDRDYPRLDRIPGDDRHLFRYVLDTKLFDAPSTDSSESRAAPVHRQIAEFLAARFLASLIDDSLPIGRVLSLIVGHDGIVVSDLRGLSAWLAAHSRTARAELIARDPVGTVLYGDVREFSPKEKKQIWGGVSREIKNRPWTAGTLQREPRLADLATPDLAEFFGRVLSEPARDDARQELVLLLLAALGSGPAIAPLANIIVEVVRDDTWLQGVRTVALYALIRHGEQYGLTARELGALLEEVDAGTMSDPDDDLLGLLLTELYPAALSVPELLQYLHTPRNLSYLGNCFSFWIDHVPEVSTPVQLVDLLDSIVANIDSLRPTLVGTFGDINYLHLFPIRLLERATQALNDDVPIDRLLDWLGVVSDPALRISPHDTGFIRPWLTGHPDVLKALIALAADRCTGSSSFSRCMHRLERVLFRTPWPPDWCLDEAVAATDRGIAEYFIYRVADFVHSNPCDETLTRDEVEKRLTDNAELMGLFDRRLAVRDEDESLQSGIREQDDEDRRQRQCEWQSHVAAHEQELRENRCPPSVLHNLAAAYFGHFVDVEGDTPLHRLRNLIGSRESLIQAVLQGFRDSINRDDVPTASEIMRLGTQSRTHYLAWPILAGLEEAIHAGSSPELLVDEDRLRLALAIHYTAAKPFAAPWPPRWFPPLVASRPDMVAEILVESVLSGLHAGTDPSANLYALVQSGDHEDVARLASLPLLRKFPVRCTGRQLSALSILLKAALLHCERAPLLELAREKLSHRSMNVSQRVYWLTAGLIASPSGFTLDMMHFVSGSERRIRHLAEFVVSRFRLPDKLLAQLHVPVLRPLISLTGSSFRPFSPRSHTTHGSFEEGAPVTLGMEAGLGIAHLIDRLAALPCRDASEALEALLSEAALRPWHAHLVDAAHRQNVRRREQSFRHFGIGPVLEVLDNRQPANAADLAALTTWYLREIAKTIRDGSTSDWRQYWNRDSHNRPTVPIPEDACRDALLSELQAKLTRLHVDAQPEGHYADDKRSDIRVSHGGFNVPVEIKKSCHRDLWSAIRTQLIAQYTRDPDTGGYGIYLVFWHGVGKCQPPESGSVPKNAATLEDRLRDTLSTEEAHLISILVVDVSKPKGKRGPKPPLSPSTPAALN